jgi:hypothetical protein
VVAEVSGVGDVCLGDVGCPSPDDETVYCAGQCWSISVLLERFMCEA